MPPQQVKKGAQKQKKTVIEAETTPQHPDSEGGVAPPKLTVTLTHLLMLPQVEGASEAGGALSAEAEEDSGASRGKPPIRSFGGHGSAFRPAVARPALPAPAAWQSTSTAADGPQQAAHVRHDTGPSEQAAYSAAGAAEGEGV